MKLYKYKSLQGDGLMHALDMLVNQRIYFSTADKMNDPHEGGFGPIGYAQILSQTGGKALEDPYQKVHDLSEKTRFTCFSSHATNPLLWAHYAGGYTGVCFEYEIPVESPHYDLMPVIYGPIPPDVSYEMCVKIVHGEEPIHASGILRAKRKEWAYEDEYRMYLKEQKSPYLTGPIPSAVILGMRGSRADSVFPQVCRKFGVRVGHLMGGGGIHGYHAFFPDNPVGKSDDSDTPGGWVNG